jgi:hypothetical protein
VAKTPDGYRPIKTSAGGAKRIGDLETLAMVFFDTINNSAGNGQY